MTSWARAVAGAQLHQQPSDVGLHGRDAEVEVGGDRLDMETTRTKLNRQLSLFAERRQALITAAVTGGITV
jgi:hypothetical protein